MVRCPRLRIKKDFLRSIQNEIGFTLVETMIALSVTLVAIATFTTIIPNSVKIQNRFDGLASLLVVGSFNSYDFSQILKSVGGNQIPVWQSVLVDNNCAAKWGLPDCVGSDRIHLLEILFDPTADFVLPPLAVATPGYNPATGSIQIDNSTGCPLNSKYQNVNIALVDGTTILIVFATSIDANTCTIQSSLSTQGSIFSNFVATSAERFVGKSALGVRIKTYFWDSQNFTINRFIDSTNSGLMSSSNTIVEYSNIYDLQVALGYYSPTAVNGGSNVGDSSMKDTGDQYDCWFRNSPLDVWGQGGLRYSTVDQLKMIAVKFAVGSGQNATIGDGGGQFQMYDGPVRQYPAHKTIRVTERKIYFRNEGLFLN